MFSILFYLETGSQPRCLPQHFGSFAIKNVVSLPLPTLSSPFTPLEGPKISRGSQGSQVTLAHRGPNQTRKKAGTGPRHIPTQMSREEGVGAQVSRQPDKLPVALGVAEWRVHFPFSSKPVGNWLFLFLVQQLTSHHLLYVHILSQSILCISRCFSLLQWSIYTTNTAQKPPLSLSWSLKASAVGSMGSFPRSQIKQIRPFPLRAPFSRSVPCHLGQTFH